MPVLNRRQTAFLKIFITSILWSSSFVLVRLGLDDMGPLMLAGIRYTLAGLLLLPVLKVNKISIKSYKKYYKQLAWLGILSFTIGNGLAGFALEDLPSTTVSFLNGLSTPLILFFSIFLLNEIPKKVQIAGVLLTLVGLVMYYFPQKLAFITTGYLFLSISLLGFTFYAILGRSVARAREVPFLIQTTVPFIVGGGLLLILAVIFEGIPVFTPKISLILIWMVAVNSIIGYLIYNQALCNLTALEVNVVIKLSPFFNAIYAYFLLGERISMQQIMAMAVVFVGVYLVQRGSRVRPTLIQ